ncbi:MAG: 23S rRNA (uracil(1939)-C(5))-methyltransferase RlmD [Proteobacteria bacterium]|nr:23S rRNA (uracil(1939)-C(5))-methyltransferase RlmD [Pseudomonadota bacterium]
MDVKKGQVLDLRVTDIAFGGKGLAKVDGFAVFIDKTVPEDQVRVRITRKKKNYAEARVLELISPSPLRTTPRCSYSGYCGGCKWQFLEYDKQLEYKTSHVSESIEHIGLMKGVLVHRALASEKIFGYRNKMEFSCSDQRWLMPEELENKDIEKGFGIGLHAPGTFNKVIDIDACHIQPELGNQILNDVRDYIRQSTEPVYGLHSHEGFWRFLMLRHSASKNNWMVNIITSTLKKDVVMPLAEQLMECYPEVTSVVNNITARKAGIAIGEYEEHLLGESFITDNLGPYSFKISANSFFQTNTKGAENLYSVVEKYAGLTGNEHVLDLYSGTGTIPIWLSSSAKEITGIEIVESAVHDARKNCLDNQVDNCSFILGDIKDVLPTLSSRPDVMIIDPPRTGMHKDVVASVLGLAPQRIVYVSCNPSTMARDIGMLKEKYNLVEVQPVDMFPHTYHIESVARLERIEE